MAHIIPGNPKQPAVLSLPPDAFSAVLEDNIRSQDQMISSLLMKAPHDDKDIHYGHQNVYDRHKLATHQFLDAMPQKP